MNKINRTDDLEVEPVMADEDETQTPQNEAETPKSGEAQDQVALRGDLIELHKRMVDMFKTLSTGLTTITTEKADKDRAVLSARIDEMERSLNTMEGMVRIEMVPQFRAVLNEALEERAIGSTSRVRSWGVAAVLIAAGITAGTVWSDEIATHWASLSEYIRGALGQN